MALGCPAGLNLPSSQSPQQLSYPDHSGQDIFMMWIGDEYGANMDKNYKLVNDNNIMVFDDLYLRCEGHHILFGDPILKKG